MLKSFVFALLASVLLFGATSHAKMQALSDTEMSNVYGSMDIGAALVSLLESKIQTGDALTVEDVIAQLNTVSQMFGVSLEDVTVAGAQYGGFQMALVKDGVLAGNVQLPSSVERIHIGAIRLGGGTSIGMLTIENIRMTGRLTVTVH